MSHIPNSAMPHAGGTAAIEPNSKPNFSDSAGRMMELARAHPRTLAAAAGAALLAGIAAAALPFARGRSSTSRKASSSRGKKNH